MIISFESWTAEVMRLAAMSRSLSAIAPGASPTTLGRGRMVKRIYVLPSLTSNWFESKVGDEEEITKRNE